MAAAVTSLGSVLDTTSGTHTVTATPAVNDLIVIVVANTGNVAQVAPTDNNGSGTYTKINSALKATSADSLEIWVRNSLITSAVSTIFTQAPGTTSGGGMNVFKVTGMSATGAAAVRQSAVQANQAAATPAPVFGVAPLTTNPIIGAVFNATSPATMTPRTSFTEAVDLGYSVPTTGLETMFRNSGETTTTQTWGSASASAFSDVIVELAYDTSPTVALNTPADAAGGQSATPALTFTGTDPNAEDVRYEVQIDTLNTFVSQLGSEIIPNPSFDTNTSGWSLDADYAWSTAVTHSGGGSVLQTSTTGFANFTTVNDGTKYTVTPGATYVFSFYAYLNTYTSGLLANWELHDNTPFAGSAFTGSSVNASGGVWTLNTVTFTAPASGFVSVRIYNNNGNHSTYYDDFSLKLATPVIDAVSGTNAGFSGSPDNTDPFASAQAVTYTVQTALQYWTTYYWRVRGKDPLGTNAYGVWSAVRSFTTSPTPGKIVQKNQAIHRSNYY